MNLSFSTIVNEIQGDEAKAAQLLIELSVEKEKLDDTIEGLEAQLALHRSRRESIKEGAKNILKHLDKEMPMAIPREKFVVVVSVTGISIERNVL